MADDNYKSTLLEYTQARSLGIPRYSVIHEEGPEHDRRFTIEVSIGATVLWQAVSVEARKKLNKLLPREPLNTSNNTLYL